MHLKRHHAWELELSESELKILMKGLEFVNVSSVAELEDEGFSKTDIHKINSLQQRIVNNYAKLKLPS